MDRIVACLLPAPHSMLIYFAHMALSLSLVFPAQIRLLGYSDCSTSSPHALCYRCSLSTTSRVLAVPYVSRSFALLRFPRLAVAARRKVCTAVLGLLLWRLDADACRGTVASYTCGPECIRACSLQHKPCLVGAVARSSPLGGSGALVRGCD